MGKRNRVTTRDIAEELGISQSTVSMILSNKPNVSFTDETVQKVKVKAKELGYKKPVPKELVQEKSLANTIVVLCPMVTNGYYSMMMQSITDHAKKYNYTVMTFLPEEMLQQKKSISIYFPAYNLPASSVFIHCQRSRKSTLLQSISRLFL